MALLQQYRRRGRLRSKVCRENALMRHDSGGILEIPSERPRLRSGFRLRTQTPAERLNFHSPSLRPNRAAEKTKRIGLLTCPYFRLDQGDKVKGRRENHLLFDCACANISCLFTAVYVYMSSYR